MPVAQVAQFTYGVCSFVSHDADEIQVINELKYNVNVYLIEEMKQDSMVSSPKLTEFPFGMNDLAASSLTNHSGDQCTVDHLNVTMTGAKEFCGSSRDNDQSNDPNRYVTQRSVPLGMPDHASLAVTLRPCSPGFAVASGVQTQKINGFVG